MCWLEAAILSALAFGCSGFIYKYCVEKRCEITYLLMGLYASGTALFLYVVYSHHYFIFNIHYLIAGAIIACGSSFGNVFVGKALKNGPASLTSPLVNLNVVAVAVVSILVFHERMTMFEAIGVTTVVAAVSLLKYDPNESMRIENKQWYLYVALAILFIFLREGGLKITLEYSFNNMLVLLYAYALSFAVFSMKGIVYGSFILRRSYNSFFFGTCMGLFSFLGMFLYAYALGKGPASVVAPLFSLRSLVIVGLSILIFKERLSAFQIVAAGLTVVATMLISV